MPPRNHLLIIRRTPRILEFKLQGRTQFGEKLAGIPKRLLTAETTNRVYGLQWNPRPAFIPRYAAICVLLCLFSIILSYWGVTNVQPKFPGVGPVYPASVFYALCTYWFGGWGVIASFVGAFIGLGILPGVPWDMALIVAIADIWEPLIPFLLLRSFGPRFGVNPLGDNILGSIPKTLSFVIFGAVLPPLISGLWGVWFLVGNRGEFWLALQNWWIGAAVLLAVFVPPLCRLMAGILRRTDLACHGIWS